MYSVLIISYLSQYLKSHLKFYLHVLFEQLKKVCKVLKTLVSVSLDTNIYLSIGLPPFS